MKTFCFPDLRWTARLSFCSALLLFTPVIMLAYGNPPALLSNIPLLPATLKAPLAAAFLTLLCASTLHLSVTARPLHPLQALVNALIPALLTMACSGSALWEAPRTWSDLGHLSPLSAAFTALALILLIAISLAKRGRHPSLLSQICLAAAPFLFNWLLLLQAPGLLQHLGGYVPSAGLWELRGQELVGRILVLAGFNVAIALIINALCIRMILHELKPYAFLLASAVFAGLTPLMADLGSTANVAALPFGLGIPAAILSVALAQAGLWAQTFLLTGLLMDALKGRRPTGYWGAHYFREGLGKGAMYSALFLGILFLVQIMVHSQLLAAVHLAQPLLAHVLLGAAFMPLAKTVLESFDGSRSFFSRLTDSYLQPRLYLRGSILGFGMFFIPISSFIMKSPETRFGLGVALGAAAYAGANIIMDVSDMIRAKRLRFQTWQFYLTGSLLGGFVGGAISWYIDPSQSTVVLNKFRLYTTLSIQNPQDYVIYPLFSKWGSMNLGPHSGSSRILFNESVSGVINWALAAPLFSVNFFFLTALFARSWAPVRLLVSRHGLIAVAEQTVRVLRWGLWMAPVIYSLLRISPDPTWYNQDGAIRTLVATWQTITLSPEAFRGWSVDTFLHLLAYDWFRIMIWFDHMGLRVATLVNLSFVGGDALDELLARFQGHAGRTRCIPEALRRFATWAPLLIPFFLPMGADWAHVWDGAEAIQKTGQGQISPLALLLAILALCVLTFLTLRGRPRKPIKGEICVACGLKRPGFSPPDEIILHNGIYTVVQGHDGRGYSRVFSAIRHGVEYDLTNRPSTKAHNAGKFLYLTEDGVKPWSLGCRPVRRTDADITVEPSGPLSITTNCLCEGIDARAEITLLEDSPVEVCRIRLHNLADRPRRLELTSYREICLNDPNPQLRHPFYNRQHIATWFVPESNALFSRNRILKTSAAEPWDCRPSPEVYFHAAHLPDASTTRLLGYEDNRASFVGDSTLCDPAGLNASVRGVDDRDMHYTFDPIASLRIGVNLAPGQSTEILLLDGYAPSGAEGSRMLQQILQLPETKAVHPTKPASSLPSAAEPSLDAMLHPDPHEVFSFSENGESLHLSWKTPRRWAHLMTNEIGYGVLATNDGALVSFMGNAQQNALTPFSPDPMTTQDPGQILYLRNVATGELSAPTFIPYREKDTDHAITFGLGHCIFRKTMGDITTEMTVFVLHDRPMEARLLRITNAGNEPVTYCATFFAQMVLADVPIDSANQIETERDQELNALYFNRPENRFQRGWAFVSSSLPCSVQETSLNRFLGEGRTLIDPYMVECGEPDHEQNDNGYRVAALSGMIEVPAKGTASMHVLMGQAQDIPTCREFMAELRRTEDVIQALDRTQSWWRETLGTVRIETNSPAFDRLVNTWLPYQALNARLWGRLGPQQRSGAFGFRDQLQDVLPLTLVRPSQARSQILLHSRQQFREGDVLQWWHQTWDGKTGLGVRNKASDPHLWLPYIVCRYVSVTGDRSILNERIPFLEGQQIPRRMEGVAFVPRISRDTGTLLEHCMRSIDRSLERLGTNGLPLMGAHDWNDGLSAVGVHGKGTSVWLGFFLHDVLRTMAPLVEKLIGKDTADRYRAHASNLRKALQSVWRSDHFARAVTDAGEMLDYSDALCSAWPLLSEAVPQEQGETALLSGLQHLEKSNMVLLLAPSFDENASPYPGRIADYPPGVRENGAQYSHGASWLVDALALLAGRMAAEGDAAAAFRWREDALRVWLKISPLAHARADELQTYGLPPHQQPADIFHGPGYEGRGGWSWYTGAAARMLWAAYSLLGISKLDGVPALNEALLTMRNSLHVKSIWMNGKQVFNSESTEKNEEPQ